MKALYRTKYGGPEVLSLCERPKPKAKSHEILVRVKASTINRTDIGFLTGKPYIARLFGGFPKPRNKITGSDFSGVVEAIGKKVVGFKPGDKVCGFHDEGLESHAEYLCIHQKKAISVFDNNYSFQEMVSFIEGFHYALNFLNKVKLKPNHRVLVNGATGAIGSAALQLLKAQGNWVTAVANTKNIELMKSLGADKTWNYEKEDFTQVETEKYHFVFDAVGKSRFKKCKALLENGGVYISSELGPYGENVWLSLLGVVKQGKRVKFPFPKNPKKSLNQVNQLLKENKLRALIDQVIAPQDFLKAFNYVASGKKTGSLVIDFS